MSNSNRKGDIFQSLKLPPGAWQIFWYGRLTEVPHATKTPFIATYLRRVELIDGEITRRTSEVQSHVVPITDISALPLGTVLNDNRVIPNHPIHNKGSVEDIVLNFNRLNCAIVDRQANGNSEQSFNLLPPSRQEVANDFEYQGNLLHVGGSSKGELPHFFPCATIFQFFWARSSTWAQMMVDGRFLDYSRYIFSPERSFLSGDRKKAMIWLRQWMLDTDAKFVATIAFDDYALEMGADIFRHLAQGSEDERRCLRALPPYQGPIPMKVIRHKVRTKNGDLAWLVHSILSCGYRPTIEELYFDRDNDGRIEDELAGSPGDKLPMNREPRQPSVIPNTSLNTNVELSHQPHQSGITATPLDVDWFRNRFPEMGQIQVTKQPQDETTYFNDHQRAIVRNQMWLDRISTLEDAATSADLAPQGILTGEDYVESTQDEGSISIMGDAFNMAHALLDFNEKVIDIGGSGWQLFVAPVIAGKQSLTPPFFLVPTASCSRRRAWRYRDREMKYPKRAVCLCLKFVKKDTNEIRITYLLDFEEREGQNQNRMLLFWRKDRSFIFNEHRIVRDIVDAVAEANTTDISSEAMYNLERRVRKHPHGDLTTFWSDLLVPTCQQSRRKNRD